MNRYNFMGLKWCLIVAWRRRWYSIVISCLIDFTLVWSPSSSSASARSDRCWRLMFCEFAIVSLSFFLARDLFLNALDIEWYDILNVLGSPLMIRLSLVLCDTLVRIWKVMSLQCDRRRILYWSSSDHGLLCKSFLIFFGEEHAFCDCDIKIIYFFHVCLI